MNTKQNVNEPSPASDLFGGIWMVVTLAQCGLWIGLALSSVHERIPATDGTEEYGWRLVWAMTCFVVSLTVAAYKWGVASQCPPNAKLERPSDSKPQDSKP